MKRFAGLIAAVLLAVLSVTMTAEAADSFKITETNPVDGYEKVQITNVMIKIFFNEDVSNDVGKDFFAVSDKNGKAVGFELIPDPDDAKNLNLLINKDLKADSKYKVVVSGDLTNIKGEKLGKDQVINFSTSNSSGGLTYMLLMMAMIAVMVAMTIRDQRKKVKEDSENGDHLKIEVNPYKLAKECNISVAEATEMIKAEREKFRKKQEKKEMKAAPSDTIKKESAKPQKKVYKVKTKRVTKIGK